MSSGIGGYYSLEAGQSSPLPHFKSASKYQSARAAIAAALGFMRPSAVWLPYYICTAVEEILATTHLNLHRYLLTEGRGVPENLPVDSNDVVICVDYFGISGSACDSAIATYGRERVLIDASQSLFHIPRENVPTVYSPRKFVGVPDGGFIVAPQTIPSLKPADEAASINRSLHLLTRSSGQIGKGHSQFMAAEASLSSHESIAMSNLTYNMISAIDFDRVRKRRVTNYHALSTALTNLGLITSELPEHAVPMCFPLSNVEGKSLQRALISHNIFSPTYWSESALPENEIVGLALRDRTVYLPCDQRYGPVEMTYIAETIAKITESR